MVKEYMTPVVRIVSMAPDGLICLSTPQAHEGEDEDERAPQSTRGFEWCDNSADNNFWN